MKIFLAAIRNIINTLRVFGTNFRRNGLRELILGIGVIFAVILMIFGMTFGNGFRNILEKSFLGNIKAEIIKMTYSTYEVPRYISAATEVESRIKRNTFTQEHIDIIEHIEGVEIVNPIAEATFPVSARISPLLERFPIPVTCSAANTELVADYVPDLLSGQSERTAADISAFLNVINPAPILPCASFISYQLLRNSIEPGQLANYNGSFTANENRVPIIVNRTALQALDKLLNSFGVNSINTDQLMKGDNILIEILMGHSPVEGIFRDSQFSMINEPYPAFYKYSNLASFHNHFNGNLLFSNADIINNDFQNNISPVPRLILADYSIFSGYKNDSLIVVQSSSGGAADFFSSAFQGAAMQALHDIETDGGEEQHTPNVIEQDNQQAASLLNDNQSDIVEREDEADDEETEDEMTEEEILMAEELRFFEEQLNRIPGSSSQIFADYAEDILKGDVVGLCDLDLAPMVVIPMDTMEIYKEKFYRNQKDSKIILCEERYDELAPDYDIDKLDKCIETANEEYEKMMNSFEHIFIKVKDVSFIDSVRYSLEYMIDYSQRIKEIDIPPTTMLDKYIKFGGAEWDVFDNEDPILSGMDIRGFRENYRGHALESSPSLGGKLWLFEINEDYEQDKKMAQTIRANIQGVETMLIAFGGVLLFLVAIGVFYAFMYLIIRREKEIGLYRFFGASKIKIVSLLVLEASIVGFACAFIGYFFSWYIIDKVLPNHIQSFVNVLNDYLQAFLSEEEIHSVATSSFSFNTRSALIFVLIGGLSSTVAALIPSVIGSYTSLFKSINK